MVIKVTEANKTLVDDARATLEKQAEETNKSRTGKGTRVKVGSTRGKNPQAISFEAFDDAQPDTHPKTINEWLDMFKDTPHSEEPAIMGYIVDGFNLAQYTAASDPIAEYVDYSWPEEVQKAFRLVVRNYANNAKVDIETAVALIKPGIVASQQKNAAATA